MLTSSLVRRMLMLFGGFGVSCVVILGMVGLSVPASDPGISALRWRMMVAELALLSVGALILAQVLRGWLIPIQELNRAVKTMTNDQLPDRMNVEREDELGELSRSFNQMVQAIESRRASVQSKQQRIESDAEQLETVLEAMVEGVIAVDQDEQILLANTAAIKLLDLKTFNVVGRRIWEVIRSPQVHDLIRSTLADREQRRLEFTVPWTYSTVAAIASRLPGTPCPGAVLVLHDVTDLRRLENLRRDFVSNVSHELKTPLAAITAYTETLLNGALDDQSVSRMFVGRISEQSERLNTLIFDLLELARIESGEHVFQLGSIEINEVLRSSLDAHQAIAEAKQLTIITEFRHDSLMGRADADGLRTIVDNLVGNAIKYSQPGGQVTIRSFQSAEWAVFELEDNGVGIAKEFQTRIFERFFRVDRARSREMGGTGLGLSIVKHLCNLFGGSVKVKSQLGQGSTFTVQLEASE